MKRILSHLETAAVGNPCRVIRQITDDDLMGIER